MPLTTLRQTGQREQVVSSAPRTTSGDSGALYGYGAVYQGVVQVNVTAVTGTTPSLTVSVEDTCDGVNWSEVAASSAITATGTTSLRISAPFSDTLRIVWDISGTTPSFTFDVWAYFESHGQPVQG